MSINSNTSKYGKWRAESVEDVASRASRRNRNDENLRLVFIHRSSRRGARARVFPRSRLFVVTARAIDLRLDEGVDVGSHVGIFKLWRVTLRRDAVLADEELFKVPAYFSPHCWIYR